MEDSEPDEDRLYRGKERALLEAALTASGLSARQAALKMDISDSRLRQIINGYQPLGKGRRVAVMAPADTLARIAMVLDITPEELDQADRRDAATELRARQREMASWGDDSGSIIDAIQQWAEDPVNFFAPDDALRFFEDSALLGELQRRLDRLREHARGVVRHGYWDTGSADGIQVLDDAPSLDERDRNEMEQVELQRKQEEVRDQQSARTAEVDETSEKSGT